MIGPSLPNSLSFLFQMRCQRTSCVECLRWCICVCVCLKWEKRVKKKKNFKAGLQLRRGGGGQKGMRSKSKNRLSVWTTESNMGWTLCERTREQSVWRVSVCSSFTYVSSTRLVSRTDQGHDWVRKFARPGCSHLFLVLLARTYSLLHPPLVSTCNPSSTFVPVILEK